MQKLCLIFYQTKMKFSFFSKDLVHGLNKNCSNLIIFNADQIHPIKVNFSWLQHLTVLILDKVEFIFEICFAKFYGDWALELLLVGLIFGK
jgi:hypothetical protein